MNEVVVAAVQFNPKILDVHKNLAVAKQLTFEAAGKGARIIVLPELCISGYNLKSAAEQRLPLFVKKKVAIKQKLSSLLLESLIVILFLDT